MNGEKGIVGGLPKPKASPKMLYDLVFEVDKPQVLRHGIEFKVFDYLSEPILAEEVARRLDTKPDVTSRLLDLLVIIGVIEKRHGYYLNTSMAEEFLVHGKPTYEGDEVLESIEMYTMMVAQIPQLLKTGITKMDMSQLPEEFWASSGDVGAGHQRAVWPNKFLPMIIEMPEFPSFKRMLDLGGGAGFYTMVLVSHSPTLRGTVLDLPLVVEKITKKTISEYGLQDRIDVLGVDFTKDDIGKDYDLVWTTECLNIVTDKVEEVVKKVYESMNPDGIFVSQHAVINKERTWPLNAAWMIQLMALTGQDWFVYETDISDAMLKAGFKSVESRYVEDYWGIDRVDIARK